MCTLRGLASHVGTPLGGQPCQGPGDSVALVGADVGVKVEACDGGDVALVDVFVGTGGGALVGDYHVLVGSSC